MEKTISTRINKYITSSGLYSRKAADVLVSQGRVFIDGEQAKLGDKFPAGAIVTVDGQIIKPITDAETIVIALNKPVGVVCTAAKQDARNIVDFVGHESRIFPVGRLDKDSQGLILLTNKSGLADKVLRSGNQHEKEYLVTVNKAITEKFIIGMSNGVPMLGVVTQICKVVKESETTFRIILTQGLNRQIRRMCRHYGYSVERLERVRIMHVDLGELATGQWRNLNKEELSVLFNG